MQQFQAAVNHQVPISQTEAPDLSHGRQLTRRVHVYRASPQLSQTWKNAQSLVVVYREGIREQTPFQTVSFYLSSLSATAVEFGLGIRQHRDIENGLHWVKDVIFEEDDAPFSEFTPALNWSTIRGFALNLFRGNGYPSLTKAIRILGNDLSRLLSLLTTN
jgi:predicted transposase YbfD/YdcC